MVSDRPREHEERSRNEYASDICQRETKFGHAVCAGFGAGGGQSIVDGVDSRHDEPDAEEETEPGTEVGETDLLGAEVVDSLVDGLEIGVERVGGCEEDGLVGGHGEDDGLDENSKRSREGGAEFDEEGSGIFAFKTVFVRSAVQFFQPSFARRENHGCISFSQEEKRTRRAHTAHQGENPKNPSPIQPLHNHPSKQRTQRRTHQRTQKIPTKNPRSLIRLKHIRQTPSPIRNRHGTKKPRERPHDNQRLHIRRQRRRNLQHGKNSKTRQIHPSSPHRLAEWCVYERSDPQHYHKSRRARNDGIGGSV